MWKSKKINDSIYLFNLENEDSVYQFYLTDLCKLWHISLSRSEIVKECQNCNQWMEGEDEILLRETIKLFDLSRNDVCWNVESSANSLKLILNSTLGSIKFCFQIFFHLCNEVDFFKIVMSPLLMIIKNLQYQKNELQDLIKKKDVEITEYKMEGAVLLRKNIETPVFEEHMLGSIFTIENQRSGTYEPRNLLDDLLISSYNDVSKFFRTSTKDEKSSQTAEAHLVKEKYEQIKVPKKTEIDVIKNESVVVGCIPSQMPVPKRKPAVRKLANL